MADIYPKYFNAEVLGQSLKEVAVEVIRTSRQDVISRWFHSSKDADLFIWLDGNKNIIKQQLSYYGQVVEWNVVEGVKTGHIVVDDAHNHTNGSEILRFDQSPQAATLEQALALLANITALNDIERQALIGNFRRAGSSVTLSPEEFVARFGAFLQRPKTTEIQATLWNRVKARLSGWFKR
jgi:hypothetical protein